MKPMNMDRNTFADFLEKIITTGNIPAEWEDFIVTHYVDDVLERIRIECVRLSIANETSFPSNEDKRRLRQMVSDLRTG